MLDHFQLCRLSRAFNSVANLRDMTDFAINEWLAEQIADAHKRNEIARKNLEAKIAAQDVERGRPLTAREKLGNLKAAIDFPTPEEFCNMSPADAMDAIEAAHRSAK